MGNKNLIGSDHASTTTKSFLFHRCPERNILSSFVYDKAQGTAEATLYSMFKFPESNRVHFQCDILVCKGSNDDYQEAFAFSMLILSPVLQMIAKNQFAGRTTKRVWVGLLLRPDHLSHEQMLCSSLPKMELSWPHIPCSLWNLERQLVTN